MDLLLCVANERMMNENAASELYLFKSNSGTSTKMSVCETSRLQCRYFKIAKSYLILIEFLSIPKEICFLRTGKMSSTSWHEAFCAMQPCVTDIRDPVLKDNLLAKVKSVSLQGVGHSRP